MRTSLLAWLVVNLVLAPGALGLTLLDRSTEAGQGQARVRVDQPPLQARTVDGEIRLAQTEMGPELAPLDVETTEWRGFANVTALPIEGEGSLLLADRGSAILLLVDAKSHPASSGPGDPDREQDAPRGDEQEARPREEPSEDPGSGGPEGSGSSEGEVSPSATRSQASPSGGDEGGLPVDPAVVGLGLTAMGAFLVELFSRSRLREP